MRFNDIRRRPDGSIDTDFHRAGARRMRAEALRSLVAGRTTHRAGMVAVLTMLVIGVAGAALHTLADGLASRLANVEPRTLQDAPSRR
jgi:hypothetical protein